MMYYVLFTTVICTKVHVAIEIKLDVVEVHRTRLTRRYYDLLKNLELLPPLTLFMKRLHLFALFSSYDTSLTQMTSIEVIEANGKVSTKVPVLLHYVMLL